MLRLRHNPPIRYIRSGRCCRTARYISVSDRSEFLFSVSNIKVNNSAAALRDATSPHFRQSVPLRKRGIQIYGFAFTGQNRFFHNLSLGITAALRDATPPLTISRKRDARFALCVHAFSFGEFKVSKYVLPARRTWPPGYPLSRAGRAPWLGLPSAGGRRPADIRISLTRRARPGGASRKGRVLTA